MRKRLRKIATAVVVLGLPNPIKNWVLTLLGHHVNPSSRIGFSIVLVDKLCLSKGASIGHLNFISCRRLVLRDQAYIQAANLIRGPFSIHLRERSGIGKRNIITRAKKPITYGPSRLSLGTLAKVTSSHTLDLTNSIFFGDFTTVAGKGSQFWTHGYYHYPVGSERFRIDGRILIGNNVYVGSACVFSMGIRVADGIMIGSHSSVSKDLIDRGLYVSQSLRRVDLDVEKTIMRLDAVPSSEVCERVYRKPR